jgi:hypothetical protein
MKTQFQAVCLVAFLLVFSLSATFGQEKTNITLGGSYWNAAYTWEDENGNKINDIGTGNMFGPYATISHGKWNFGLSLLWGSFPVDKLAESEVADINMSRGDFNLTIGYRVHPYINIFVGSKFLNWSLDASYTATILQGYDFFGTPIYESRNVKAKISEKGVLYGLGISGVVPFGTSGWYGFASLAGMGGTLTDETTYEGLTEFADFQNVKSDISAALAALNLGIGYRMPSGFGINAGYRADLFSEDAQDSQDNPRIHVQGLILTASYSF